MASEDDRLLQDNVCVLVLSGLRLVVVLYEDHGVY